MQKGLDYLLEKYAVPHSVKLAESGSTVMIDGASYPILEWEDERRIVELANIKKSGRLGNVCTYRIAHTTSRGADLFKLLYREAGILTYTLGERAKDVFAISSGNCMNLIIECESGTVATLELAATLGEGKEDIDKHEMIAEVGVACDRVVDTQIPQHSIYVFGKDEAKYRDTDAELMGYSELQTSIIRCAFRYSKNLDMAKAAVAKAEHIEKIVEAAKASLATLECVKVGE